MPKNKIHKPALKCSPLLLVFALILPLSAYSQNFVKIQNRWKNDQFLHIENGSLQSGVIQSGWHSARWILQKVSGTNFVRLNNFWKKNQYIHIEYGNVQVGDIQPGWWSAMWIVEPVQGTSFIRLRNRWKPGQYLHIEYGNIRSGPIERGWWSAMWALNSSRQAQSSSGSSQQNGIRTHQQQRTLHLGRHATAFLVGHSNGSEVWVDVSIQGPGNCDIKFRLTSARKPSKYVNSPCDSRELFGDVFIEGTASINNYSPGASGPTTFNVTIEGSVTDAARNLLTGNLDRGVYLGGEERTARFNFQ